MGKQINDPHGHHFSLPRIAETQRHGFVFLIDVFGYGIMPCGQSFMKQQIFLLTIGCFCKDSSGKTVLHQIQGNIDNNGCRYTVWFLRPS